MAGKEKKQNQSRTQKRSTRRSTAASSKAAAKPVQPAALAVLNADKLKELYATMLKCRLLAEHVRNLPASTPQAGKSVLPGLEATMVGAGAHLRPQDSIALEQNDFTASLIRGISVREIVAQLQNPQPANGEASQSNPNDTAGKLSLVTGLTQAHAMKGKGAVTLVLYPQEPASFAFAVEAMELAATHKLPIVCLATRSEPDVHIPAQQPAESKPDSVYYPRITTDGCDVVAVFRVAQEAIRRAREGHGPTWIECLTTSGNHTASDPLGFMEQYLKRRGLWLEEWSSRIAHEFTEELDASFALSEDVETPLSSSNVYSNAESS